MVDDVDMICGDAEGGLGSNFVSHSASPTNLFNSAISTELTSTTQQLELSLDLPVSVLSSVSDFDIEALNSVIERLKGFETSFSPTETVFATQTSETIDTMNETSSKQDGVLIGIVTGAISMLTIILVVIVYVTCSLLCKSCLFLLVFD